MAIGKSKFAAWWRAQRARMPNLSTFVMFLFAGASVAPWIGYEQVTEVDRTQQISSAKERLELLAALYGERAIQSGQSEASVSAGEGVRASSGVAAPEPGALDWTHALPEFGKAKFSIRPMRPPPVLKTGTEVLHAPNGPQNVKVFHNNGVLTAEADFPATGIVAAASLTDADLLDGWMTHDRILWWVMIVRTMLMIVIGTTLFRQLRWRESAQVELIRTREAAVSATRAKSEFLANMSHELRTPLNAIIGFSEAIKLGIFGPISSQYREYGGDILQSGAHLLQLVNDLLDLAKLEAGRFELDEAVTDIPTVIGAAMRLVEPLATTAKVALRVDLPAGLPPVHADGRRLQQAVLNLASNAVKFTPPGGEVRVSACEERDQFLIRVTDTGIGMAKEQIPRALEPFRQLNSRLRNKHGGTGLGLPIARDLIELHGGILTIDSEVGVGTTVMIRLPPARILRHLSALHGDGPAAVAV